MELIDKKIDTHTAYDRIMNLNERINKELKLSSTLENGTPVIVSEPKEWYINNADKAETRGVIVELLRDYLKERISKEKSSIH